MSKYQIQRALINRFYLLATHPGRKKVRYIPNCKVKHSLGHIFTANHVTVHFG